MEYTEFKKTYGIPYKRNSENTLQLSPQFSEKIYLYYKLLRDTLMLLKNILAELRTQLPILLREPQTQLLLLLGDSINLEKDSHLYGISQRTANQKSMNIGEQRAQLAIILRDSKNLGNGLVWKASKLKMAISDWRNIFKISKPEAVPIQV